MSVVSTGPRWCVGMDQDGASVFFSLDKYSHISMLSAIIALCLGGFVLMFVLCSPCMSCGSNTYFCNFLGVTSFLALASQSLVFIIFASNECGNINSDVDELVLGGRGCYFTDTSWILICSCAVWTLVSASLCIFPEPIKI